MVKPLTTHLFGFLVVLTLSLFLLMNEQSSSLVLVSVVSLVMVYLKRGFATMIHFLIVFVVRTYVFHLLETYVIILCNWLIL